MFLRQKGTERLPQLPGIFFGIDLIGRRFHQSHELFPRFFQLSHGFHAKAAGKRPAQ